MTAKMKKNHIQNEFDYQTPLVKLELVETSQFLEWRHLVAVIPNTIPPTLQIHVCRVIHSTAIDSTPTCRLLIALYSILIPNL